MDWKLTVIGAALIGSTAMLYAIAKALEAQTAALRDIERCLRTLAQRDFGGPE